MAVKPKQKPDDVPVGKVKRESGAVTKSIRPKTIEKRPRDRAKEFGDLEYRADLDTQLSWNPIARLGFDPDRHKVIRPGLDPAAAYLQQAGNLGKNALESRILSAEDAAKIQTDTVITGSDISVPPVISHEFTHRGFNILRNKMYKDPEGFEEKYGEQARKILEGTDREERKGSDFEEYYVELFDDLNTKFNSAALPDEYESFPTDDLRNTIQSSKFGSDRRLQVSPIPRFRDTRIRQIKAFQDNIEKARKKGKLSLSAQSSLPQDINNGILGLMDAAQDILTEQGEPPKAKRKSLSFFEKLTKMFGYNEGGTVMDEQMEMAFMMSEGGLKDDGMYQDPVSGNDVPSGSLAEEVRDNIPAQLSEGEYVVPADVVRYYGVKFFEDIRDSAKMGLQDMEINGRIGGEPVPAGGPTNTDELSPQEMQAIQEMMGMAEGGEVQNPYMQQQLLYSQPRPVSMDEQNKAIVDSINPVENQMPMQTMAEGGEVKGYAPGGLEQSFLNTGQSAVNRGFVGFPLGSTIFPSEKTGQTVLGPVGTQVATTGAIDTAITGTADTDTSMLTTVTLYGPNGEIVTLTLPTDQARYDQLISEGYTTEMPVAGEPVVKGGGDDDDKLKTDPNAWMDKFNYDNFDELSTQTSNMLKKAPVLGAIGAFINGSTAAQAAANIIVMKASGQDVTQLEADWKKFVNGDIVLRNLPKELINGDKFAKDIAKSQFVNLGRGVKDIFGNDIFKDDADYQSHVIQMRQNTTANVEQAAKDTVMVGKDKSRVYKPSGIDVALLEKTDTSKAAQEARKKSKKRSAASKAAMERAQSKLKKDGTTSTVIRGKKVEGSGTKTAAGVKALKKAYEKEGGTWASGGRAEGGLMSKGKNK